jgi:hypothetical protein
MNKIFKNSPAGWRGLGGIKTTHGRLHLKIPATLHELTLGQLMAMQDKKEMSDMEAISILSGVTVDALNTVINFADLEALGEQVLALSQQITHLYNSDAVPGYVTFLVNGQTVKVNVIRNLSVEPAGAFMAARDIIAEEIKEHAGLHGDEDWKENFSPSLKACCQVLAHYFYCRATGNRYNEYQADEFCTEIKKLRVTEALPIAKHFFTCYPALSKPRTSCLDRIRQRWSNGRASARSKSLSTSTP